ncbi:hypothetical protein EYF80_033452 [Liparis tanakae]|uniref:Uncharacterized protein n=1 Tax=Liparis tanakae TaxID=230148 RepID=A0A4Z2GSQ8_9TELE|nr:hypothetical protein EYF80_033452 [Liparis tanakae]
MPVVILHGYSPMKDSEALSLTLILSSLCPFLVSSHLTRWHRTITSQRYFLNVSSGGEGFPVGPRQPESEGGTPTSAMALSSAPSYFSTVAPDVMNK